MKIDFKTFNKLKQLDRIEYLLKINNIRKQYDYNYYSPYFVMFYISFLILMLLGFYSAFHTIPIKIIKTIPLTFYSLILLVILDFFIGITNYLKEKKCLKIIYDEFFEVKSK